MTYCSFTQDVSDRTEKEKAETSIVVQRLEIGSDLIIKYDWKKHITEELHEGKQHHHPLLLDFLLLFLTK